MPATIAAIQMCSSHVVDENLSTAGRLIAIAARNKANIVVLPEMFAIMGEAATDKVYVREVFGSGKIQDFLSQQAQEHKIWIVGGTIPIACEATHKVRAASIVFNDKGHAVARYDKIHLFDITLSDKEVYKESDTTLPGNQIVLVDTPYGKLGLAVCYDVRFPELFRCLFNKGAEIIILPSAFTVPTGVAHWEVLTRARAIENFSYLVGACQGGAHSNGRKTFGNSLIIDPWGAVLAKKEGVDEGIIYADLDLDRLYEARKSIPIQDHQRIFFDTEKLDEKDNLICR